MQSEKTALGYCVTKINLMQKLILRNPSVPHLNLGRDFTKSFSRSKIPHLNLGEGFYKVFFTVENPSPKFR
jgi:hypothetical protein